MPAATVLRAQECDVIDTDWGQLTWFANAKLGNSDAMTVGRCILAPGAENPLHSHPNCSEVLVVMQGRIRHLIEDGAEVDMDPGDVITLPANLVHKAKNISDVDAVLLIAFSSADRRTQGE